MAIVMKQKEAASRTLTYIEAPTPERCHCPPLSMLHRAASSMNRDPLRSTPWISACPPGGVQSLEGTAPSVAPRPSPSLRSGLRLAEFTLNEVKGSRASFIEGPDSEAEQVIPISPELSKYLCEALHPLFPRSTPFSLILLHVSQLEHVLTTTHSSAPYQQLRFHPPASFLDQVLAYVRRTIRAEDQILVHEGIGAVMLFPDVDQQGLYRIVERIYQNINLLQAETVIPPLKRVTDVLLGAGSYPEPATSEDHLLYHTGLVVRKLTLRPLLPVHFSARQPASAGKATDLQPASTKRRSKNNKQQVKSASYTSIPFMHLPAQLPQHLKQLVPYRLALQIRCAPVGRDHNRLTIALANPMDSSALCKLSAVTGLTIFPVSCQEDELDALLEHPW